MSAADFKLCVSMGRRSGCQVERWEVRLAFRDVGVGVGRAVMVKLRLGGGKFRIGVG